MGWDGMGWDGMGWYGMEWDGMGLDSIGWNVLFALVTERRLSIGFIKHNR